MKDILNQHFFGNTVFSYLLFLLIFALSVTALQIFKHIILKRIHAWAQKPETFIDGSLILKIQKYLLPVLYMAAFYCSFQTLNVPVAVSNAVDILVKAFIACWCASFGSSLLIFIFNKKWESKSADEKNRLAIRWVGKILGAVLWIIVAILFLENIGIHVNTLVAGLGIGGIAVAFAAQAALEDMFSFVTILFDRPFEIGDFIVVGDQAGTVEHIGIKTTRLRSVNGEELIFSNKDLTNSRVQNYKRMERRRALFTLGVTYDTPVEKLREIPALIKGIIEEMDGVSFDRAHFSAYAASSLNFEAVYYVLSGDYMKYMDIQQEINFRIKEEFDNKQIAFAFPTQTLYMQNVK